MRSPSLIHFNIRSYFVRCEKIVALQNQHKAEKELSGGVIEKDAIYIWLEKAIKIIVPNSCCCQNKAELQLLKISVNRC